MRARRPIEPPADRGAVQFGRRAALVAAAWLASTALAGLGCDRDTASSDKDNSKNSNRAPLSPPRPPTAEEMALVAPLAKGSSLGGWEVFRIEGTDDRGAMRVVCVKDRAAVRLYIALAAPSTNNKDDKTPEPPATAGPYAIFYSLKNAAAEDGERLAIELAAVIEKNRSAPPPPGITPFVPRPAEPIWL